MSSPKSPSRPLRALSVGVAVVSVAAVAACSSSGGGSKSPTSPDRGLPDSIPVTATLDLTGPLAFYGTQVKAGLKAGIAEVAKSGVLGSSKLELTVKDTTGSATTAASLTQSAVNSGAVAVIGSPISNEALAGAPVASGASVPFFAPCAPGSALTDIGKYVYSMSTSEFEQLSGYVASLVKKDPKITVVYANDNDTTVGLSKSLKDAVSQNGGQLVASIPTPIASTDFSALATKAMQGSPDAIGIMSGGPQLPGLISKLRAVGYKGIIFANEGADGTVDSAGSAADGLQFQGEWASNVSTPASKTFAAIFAKTNPGVTPHYPAIDGYDSIMFLAQALAKAKATNGADLLAGLQQVAGAGLTVPGGTATFTGDGKQQLQSPTLNLVYQGGKVLKAAAS